jgi:hypothetical protein
MMPRCGARTINEPFLMVIQMKEKESLLAQRNLEEAKARVDTLVHEQQVHKVCSLPFRGMYSLLYRGNAMPR